jgi:hypothetical protein
MGHLEWLKLVIGDSVEYNEEVQSGMAIFRGGR